MLCSSSPSQFAQAEVEIKIGGKWEVVRRVACELSCIKRQVNSVMFFPSQGKTKMSSAAGSAILDLIQAEVLAGGDSRPSMQSGPR
jgi:hypothetical protein